MLLILLVCGLAIFFLGAVFGWMLREEIPEGTSRFTFWDALLSLSQSAAPADRDEQWGDPRWPRRPTVWLDEIEPFDFDGAKRFQRGPD